MPTNLLAETIRGIHQQLPGTAPKAPLPPPAPAPVLQTPHPQELPKENPQHLVISQKNLTQRQSR